MPPAPPCFCCAQVAQAKQRIAHAEAVYRGIANSTLDSQPYVPLGQELPHVSEAAFKHTVCLVFSRALSALVAPSEGVELRAPYLLPLVDLINHADEPNTESSGGWAGGCTGLRVPTQRQGRWLGGLAASVPFSPRCLPACLAVGPQCGRGTIW